MTRDRICRECYQYENTLQSAQSAAQCVAPVSLVNSWLCHQTPRSVEKLAYSTTCPTGKLGEFSAKNGRAVGCCPGGAVKIRLPYGGFLWGIRQIGGTAKRTHFALVPILIV